jgi:mutator protein MutT
MSRAEEPGVGERREYPERPVVGVGGVVIREEQVLLVRRGSEPLKGQWSIPGGMLELGETLTGAVVREMREETSLDVRVVELIEAFERIFPGDGSRPQYHFVILDYLCEAPEGTPQAGSDVTDVAFATEEELERYSLTPTALRVIRHAFAMARLRAEARRSSS